MVPGPEGVVHGAIHDAAQFGSVEVIEDQVDQLSSTHTSERAAGRVDLVKGPHRVTPHPAPVEKKGYGLTRVD